MAVIELKPERHRKPGPYKPDRHCEDCNALLSRYNPSNHCAPCSGGDWTLESPTEAQVLKMRRIKFEGLADLEDAA